MKTINSTEKEFLIFSDMHFYNNPSKSRIVDGEYSWFSEQVKVFRSIMEYALENNIHIVIHNGDLFEQDTKINVHTYNKVWELFNKYFLEGIYFILNVGNHDIYSLKHDHSLIPLTSIADVVDYYYSDYKLNDLRMRLIPFYYTGMKEEYVEGGNENSILFTHEVINGLSWKNITAEDFTDRKWFKKWHTVFNGHIHKPQEIDNIVNIGSPMIHDFGESEERKRFIHWKDFEWKSVNVDCPMFHELDYSELTEESRDWISSDNRNYFRIKVPASALDDDLFKKFNVFKEIVEAERKEMRLDLTPESTEEDEIEQYIKVIEHDLDPETLRDVGNYILKRYRGDNND